MNKHIYHLAALSLLLAGCASSTSHWDNNFGSSVRASVAAQTADPAAVRNADPVAGLDGRAARAVQARYERSYASPDAAPASMTTGSSK